MKKIAVTLLFLFLTAALVLLRPAAAPGRVDTDQPFSILRVWNGEKEPAVAAWLRNRTKAYEKETGKRVYLRAAAGAELADPGAFPPDLLIYPGAENAVALRGYALVVRDEQGSAVTPAPTGALFYRPPASPGPAATPAPSPDLSALGAVLAPEELMDALPGTVRSADPVGDFLKGKADAALLTPGQTAQLGSGCRTRAVPDGKGFLAVSGRSYSPEGEAFLLFLASVPSQRALGDFGLFSQSLSLYTPDDPIRWQIDASLR